MWIKSIPVCMDLAAAATKHYGNMTGRYSWPGQHADSKIGCKGSNYGACKDRLINRAARYGQKSRL